MKIILSLVWLVILSHVSFTVFAQTPKKDYVLYSAVYAWYGQLDIAGIPEQDVLIGKGVNDFSYLQTEQGLSGAHHILNINLLDDNEHQMQVEVTLDYYYQVSSQDTAYQGQSSAALPARYLVQRLILEKDPLGVIDSHNVINELDAYPSRFIPSAERNLIRGLLYQWTDLLDHPEEVNVHAAIDEWVDINANFQGAELNVIEPHHYFFLLEALGHRFSRREIKNVRIIPLENEASTYQVHFEYQWMVLNSFGEKELAQIGVRLKVKIVDKRAVIKEYEEVYLPPVTDLGAEIRC
ncbi:hypothetical protein [uncultured Shewanella sp.]|uniref:hypothetical protein n=1 Tax=uncultured Shewanella sp. TaxID=173975 RepID=UPI002617D64B|nr:hypothetical protein [uncultured Shewanella sp.]